VSLVESPGREQLSCATRMVAAEIVRHMDPRTGRARITAEELADKLDIAVGTVRKATSVLAERGYFRKVKVGRNIEFTLAPQADHASSVAE
jgi:predicted transcriptional regulator of viral defense system